MSSTRLEDTTASDVAAALSRERQLAGSPTLGMVLTLVVATDERNSYDAQRAAVTASREHPSRIITVINRAPRDRARLDAELSVGDGAPGQSVTLRLYGHLGDHCDSVVLPLLVPDTPVVVWWPAEAPPIPGETPLGALAQRRITDAAAVSRPLTALSQRAASYRNGDTDLAWTRLTPWRTLLAAALDEPYDPITSVEIAAARSNPSAALLASWLGVRLSVPATCRASRGPGVTAVRLGGPRGDIAVTRPDGVRATLSRPGAPDRSVALPRRSIPDLLAEELRRLDADEPYAEALANLAGAQPSAPTKRGAAKPRKTATPSAEKSTPTAKSRRRRTNAKGDR